MKMTKKVQTILRSLSLSQKETFINRAKYALLNDPFYAEIKKVTFTFHTRGIFSHEIGNYIFFFVIQHSAVRCLHADRKSEKVNGLAVAIDVLDFLQKYDDIGF